MRPNRPLPSSRTSLHSEFEARSALPLPFLLECALETEGASSRSIAGSDPFAMLMSHGRSVTVSREGETATHEADPFDLLEQILDELNESRERPESVIAVGYFGYDLAQHLERLPRATAIDQDFPEMLIGFYDRTIHFDPRHETLEEICDERPRRRAFDAETYRSIFRTKRSTRSSGRSNFERDEYLAAIRRAKKYIEQGDIYQVNLSQRFDADYDGDAYALFRRLRALSPSPYAAYIEFGERAIISSSPELFLRVENGRVTTRPIKGTRPRGETPARDSELREQLLTSEKDAAELVMIVDLERNDLGKVCTPGSVQVSATKQIEAHPTVWHLSATVEGELDEGRGPVDVLRAAFPGGSVTGAPKIRAMEIIDELEPTRRSVFTGAIGWLTPGGSMELSVAIRTMQSHGTRATFQAGGAIVWDSDPDAEYCETLDKARAMASAAGVSLG